MAERFKQLQKSSDCLYADGSPLVILASALLKDTQTDAIIAQLKLQSIDDRCIIAVFADFEAEDISGNRLKGVENFQYLDLNAKRNESFGAKTAVNMPDDKTRQFTVKIKRVIFSNNTKWEAPLDAVWNPIIKEPLITALGDVNLAEQYKRDTVMLAEYAPKKIFDLWMCTCGSFNRNTEEKCCSCKTEKNKAVKAFDKNTLEENLDTYNKKLLLEEEQRRASYEADIKRQRTEREAKAEKLRKTIKKSVIIGTPIIALIITVFIILNATVIPASNYAKANIMLDQKKYAEASILFSKVKEYKDSQEKLITAKIGWVNYLNEKTFSYHYMLKADGTIQKNNPENVMDSSYHNIPVYYWRDIVSLSYSGSHLVGLKSDGTVVAEGDNSHEQCKVSGYDNIAAVRAIENATLLYKTDGSVILVGGDYYTMDLQVSDIIDGREGFFLKADGTIEINDLYKKGSYFGLKDVVAMAIDSDHSAFLLKNGRVKMEKNESDSKYDFCVKYYTGSWHDIIALSTGQHYLVGLKSDGTVVATGYNNYNQCDLSGWTDITAISTPSFMGPTYGMKSNGTIVKTNRK